MNDKYVYICRTLLTFMEPLQLQYNILLKNTEDSHYRYLYSRVNWDQRMIAIKGARGVGKTTMMLQHIKFGIKEIDKAIYVSADHPWFYNNSLLDLAQNFAKYGGKYLFIDEVHKYPNWSRELKTIYDGNPELKIVFSASSVLDIYRGEADLSRRVITYQLNGMSFREYLKMQKNLNFTSYSFTEIVGNHQEITRELLKKIKPLPLFKEYLERGYFPYSFESAKGEYYIKLNQTINTIIENDLAFVEGYSAGSVIKLKKLLGVIAESVPFHPNISALSAKLNISRDVIYNYLEHLRKAKILNFIHSAGKGVSTLQKPDKIYLENTNINFALREHPDKGNVRETFALNQLLNAGVEVASPKNGDFLVDSRYVLEIGGKSKKGKQIKDIKEAYIISDEMEYGFGNHIPLWLLGFLY